MRRSWIAAGIICALLGISQLAFAGASEAEIPVIRALDGYFCAKLDALTGAGDVTALRPLVDLRSKDGQELYAYEYGRLRFGLACFALYGVSYSEYEYRPEIAEVRIYGQRARIKLVPRAYLHAAGSEAIDEWGSDSHEVVLVNRDDA